VGNATKRGYSLLNEEDLLSLKGAKVSQRRQRRLFDVKLQTLEPRTMGKWIGIGGMSRLTFDHSSLRPLDELICAK